ncbi:hypothetical protein [Streptomyces sp. NPDC006012]|uniref:hypothetical protein n=1 Tax=Streptomyces sp. NPDC006012 TaxID=3364739 RepID=UPI003685A4E0
MSFRTDREVPGLIVDFGDYLIVESGDYLTVDFGDYRIIESGDYPMRHGGAGAVRGPGRLGAPRCVITEYRCTPAASSRCPQHAFVRPTSGAEEPGCPVEGLQRAGRRVGRPVVLIPTDEEAAVLTAGHQDVLADRFLVREASTTSWGGTS